MALGQHLKLLFRMSRLDVKQYLEKIYNVPVLKVNIEIRQGITYNADVHIHIIFLRYKYS